ncbi:hypothetical protein BGZ73_004649 [Actinomortierella ambigua]|nr:hypothetical protein BGZ73_004649 [Actinomortierella ambigua]
MTKSRSPRKLPAAARSGIARSPAAEEEENTTLASSAAASTGRSGRQSVGWRALDEVYARETLPHPYFNKSYLDIVQVKLLDDRKTYQYWYRPIPSGSVTAHAMPTRTHQVPKGCLFNLFASPTASLQWINCGSSSRTNLRRRQRKDCKKIKYQDF